MDEKIKLLKDVFEIDLSLDDLDREVSEALPWDSFHIMNYLVEAEEQFGNRISIEQISEIKKIRELLDLTVRE